MNLHFTKKEKICLLC